MNKIYICFFFLITTIKILGKEIYINDEQIYYSSDFQNDNITFNIQLSSSYKNLFIQIRCINSTSEHFNLTLFRDKIEESSIKNITSINYDYILKSNRKYSLDIKIDKGGLYKYLIYVTYGLKKQILRNINIQTQAVHFINPIIYYFIQPMKSIVYKENLEYYVDYKNYSKEYNYEFYYKIYTNTNEDIIEQNLPKNKNEYTGKLNVLRYFQFTNTNYSINDYLLIGLYISRNYDNSINYNNINISKIFKVINLNSNFTLELDENESKIFSVKNTTTNSFILFQSNENKIITNGNYTTNGKLYLFNKTYNKKEFVINLSSDNQKTKYSLSFINSSINVYLSNHKKEDKNSIMHRIELNPQYKYYIISINHNYFDILQSLIIYPEIIYGSVDIYYYNLKYVPLNYFYKDDVNYLFSYPPFSEGNEIIVLKPKGIDISLIKIFFYKPINNEIKTYDPIGKTYPIYLNKSSKIKLDISSNKNNFYIIGKVIRTDNLFRCVNFNRIDKPNSFYQLFFPLNFEIKPCSLSHNVLFLLQFSYPTKEIKTFNEEIYNKKITPGIYALSYLKKLPFMNLTFHNLNIEKKKIKFYDDFILTEHIYSPDDYSNYIELSPKETKSIIFLNPYNNSKSNLNKYQIIFEVQSNIKIDFYFNPYKSNYQLIIIIIIIIFVIIIFIIILMNCCKKTIKVNFFPNLIVPQLPSPEYENNYYNNNNDYQFNKNDNKNNENLYVPYNEN